MKKSSVIGNVKRSKGIGGDKTRYYHLKNVDDLKEQFSRIAAMRGTRYLTPRRAAIAQAAYKGYSINTEYPSFVNEHVDDKISEGGKKRMGQWVRKSFDKDYLDVLTNSQAYKQMEKEYNQKFGGNLKTVAFRSRKNASTAAKGGSVG